MDELQRDFAAEQAVGAFGEPYAAHPTATEERQDSIRAELFPHEPGTVVGQGRGVSRQGVRVIEEPRRLRGTLRSEQVLQKGGEVGLALLEAGEPCGPLGRRNVYCIAQQLGEPRELGRAQVERRGRGVVHRSGAVGFNVLEENEARFLPIPLYGAL